MISIDGSIGEGGGQIVRTSLALSLCLGKAFSINHIRVKRSKPGLGWQHLTAVKAAAEIGKAEVYGAEHKSTEFTFVPQGIQDGNFNFDIGTAGSTSLVIQTILPALLSARNSSTIVLSGGTHNQLSPSYDFIAKSYLPVLRKMGAKIQSELIRPGYVPKGGGLIKLNVEPIKKLLPLQLESRGEILQIKVTARVAGLPVHIAQREISTVQQILNLNKDQLIIEEQAAEYGPGNVLIIEIQSENITEVFTGYGRPHLPAEKVASQIALEAQQYLAANVPVGRHLADQLLLPMALAGKGSLLTMTPSSHTLTNIQVIRQFLDLEIKLEKLSELTCKISIG